MTQSIPIRILIVDDHPLLRQGIAAILNTQEDFTVCGEISASNQVLAAVQKTDPQVILLDISLNGTNGMEVLKNVKSQFPKIKVLILSMHDETVYAPRALRAGASGYIMKEEAPERVINALRKILNNEVYVSPRMGTKLLNAFAGKAVTMGSLESLSDRELEVFTLIGQGNGTGEIAKRLFLSMKTIESHRSHIKEKLHLDTGARLVKHAIEWTANDRMDQMCLGA